MPDMPFSSYRLLAKLDGRIVAESPMRIGAGRSHGVLESDLPIVKDTQGTPVIPGSSLKGFFRGNLQRILYMLNKADVEPLLNEIFGGKGEEEWASAILFHEIKAENGKYKIAERKHIAINPEKGSVSNLFDVECVMDGSTFKGTMFAARNVSPKGLALLKTVVDATNIGLARLGGFKSRGYGIIRIELDELVFILPGKSVYELKNGVTINDLIPTKFGSIQLSSAQFKVNGDTISIDGVEVHAKVDSVPAFFGVKIIIGGEEIAKLFEKLLEMVA